MLSPNPVLLKLGSIPAGESKFGRWPAGEASRSRLGPLAVLPTVGWFCAVEELTVLCICVAVNGLLPVGFLTAAGDGTLLGAGEENVFKCADDCGVAAL